MTIPTISTLPTAPARTDAPATFITRADAFLAALVVMQGELNTSIGAMNADFITIGNNLTAAQAAQTAAEAAQAAAETAETNAETAETNAETAQSAAEAAQSAAESAQSSTEAVYDAFDDRYLGAKASDPALDNDGNALQTGAQYFNTTTDTTRVYNGSGWQDSAAIATSITVSQITDLTANAAEINTLDGITATTAELNYTDGVTSSIQTQLDSKAVYPSQTGNDGKFLKTDGSTTSWGEVSASPTASIVASGSLSDGSLVSLRTDGKVEVTTDSPLNLGTATQATTTSGNCVRSAYDAVNQVIIIAFIGQSDNDGYIVAGSVSGQTITFGATTKWLQGTLTGTYDFDIDIKENGVFCIVYNQNYSDAFAVSGKYDGTNFSFGGSATVSTDEGKNIRTVYDPNEDKFFISYWDDAFTGSTLYRVATVNDATYAISLGSEGTLTTESSAVAELVYDPDNQNIVYVYYSGNVRVIIATISGTSATFTTPQTIVSVPVNDKIAIAYDTINKKFLVAYRDNSNSSYATGVVVSIVGSSITVGTPAVFSAASNTVEINVGYNPAHERFSLAYRDGGSGNNGMFAEGAITGLSIDFSTATLFQSNQTRFYDFTADPNSGNMVMAYQPPSALPSARVIANTRSNYKDFIGISSAAYTDGQTANIQLVGSIDDSQTGLTTGKNHYVQFDGSLSTTEDAAATVYAGVALSSSSLLIKG